MSLVTEVWVDLTQVISHSNNLYLNDFVAIKIVCSVRKPSVLACYLVKVLMKETDVISLDTQAYWFNLSVYKALSVLVGRPVTDPTCYRRCLSWMHVRTPQLWQTVLVAGAASALNTTQAVRSSL